MEWEHEIVYAVVGFIVSGVLGWLIRGLSNKPEMQRLERRLDEAREERRKEVEDLRERIGSRHASQRYSRESRRRTQGGSGGENPRGNADRRTGAAT